MNQWKEHLKSERVDELLRIHAEREEAERVAREYPVRYAKIRADVRRQSLEVGLPDPHELRTQH